METSFIHGNMLRASNPASDYDDCQEQCLDESNCVGFSFYLGHCLMFNSYTSIVTLAQSTVGNKEFNAVI